MASGTISRQLKIGSPSTITLPFTAPSDGFCTAYCNPKTASGGYIRIQTTAEYYGAYTGSGEPVSVMFPVCKGYSVEQSKVDNATLTVKFFPFS